MVHIQASCFIYDPIGDLADPICFAKGHHGAKKKEIREVTPAADSFASAQTVEKVYMPLKTKQTQMLGGGDAKAGAVELIEKLRTEVRVL